MRLRPLLQRRLGITHIFSECMEGTTPVDLDKVLRGCHSTIEIQRSDHRLAGAGENHGLPSPAAVCLGMRKNQILRQSGGFRRSGTSFLPHERIEL